MASARACAAGPAGLRVVAAVVVAAVGCGAASLLWASRTWPLVHDGPLMHYVAWRILDGAVPYRDLFDMNMPGVYAIHALALVTLGSGDLAFRVFDVATLLVAAGGVAAAVRPLGPWGGAAGAAAFALYHVAGGAWVTGQRELLLCAALAWAGALLVRALADPARTGPLAGAALAVGVGVWIKPHAGLLALALVAVAWRHPARGRALAAVGAGLGAPAALALGWLAAAGALAAFVDIVLGYLIPLYGRLGRVSLADALRRYDFGAPVLAGLGLWGALGAGALAAAGERRGLAVLLAGVTYGAVHYGAQGRGWEYHAYPLALGVIALGAAGLSAALRDGRRALAAALLLVLAGVGWTLFGIGERNLAPPWIAAKAARARAVAELLRPDVAAGGTVQVLDTTEGGIAALLRVRAREPTRFIYDFHFYHDVERPYVRRLRAELVAGLAARPPAAVVLFETAWPVGRYDRLDGFSELSRWLVGGYRLAVEGDGFRLYRRVAGATAAGGSGG